MRNLVLFLVGAALGALIAATAINSIARRNAYPRGVMEVMQHQVAALRDAQRSGTCGNDARAAKALLLQLTEDIGPSTFGDTTPDPPFREYTQRLRDAVAALPDAASVCPPPAANVSRIANACDECHRQYR